MYEVLAAIIGIIIALMVSVNGVLAETMGNQWSLPIIHLSGLIFISLLLLITREKKLTHKVPFILNTGGVIGILIVLLNNRCFLALGASMTLTLGVVGQTFGSITADTTGFLGTKKYPFQYQKIPGLILLLLGIVVMTETWKGDILNILLAFFAGILAVLSLLINSRLSLRIGIFHGVRRNYIVGFLGSIILLLILRPPLSSGNLTEIHPLFLIGGGFLGVLVVAGCNKILPKIPVIYTTLLIFLGQVGTGIIIDFFIEEQFPLRKLLGSLIILFGFLQNLWVDKRSQKVKNDSKI